MVELVQKAESEIHKRRLELSQDHNGTQEEREARRQCAEWSEGSANGCGCLAGAAESEVGSSSKLC